MKKINLLLSVAVVAALVPVSAFAVGPMDDILAAVSMAGVATFVGVTGVAIVGVALAFKGISLAKRAVSKA